MKKLIALMLGVLMLLGMTACKKEDAGASDQGEDSAPAVSGKVTYGITYNSVSIMLGADASPVLDALGSPTSEKEGGNCAGQGTLTEYTYPSIKLIVLTVGDKKTVDQITFTDDGIKTPEGITIGSSREDVIAAYGEIKGASDTSLTYTAGQKSLKLVFKDGFVKSLDFILST